MSTSILMDVRSHRRPNPPRNSCGPWRPMGRHCPPVFNSVPRRRKQVRAGQHRVGRPASHEDCFCHNRDRPCYSGKPAFREGSMVKKLVFCAVLIAASFCGPVTYAQQPEPIKRTLLQKGDFPGDKMATQLMLLEVVPNG